MWVEVTDKLSDSWLSLGWVDSGNFEKIAKSPHSSPVYNYLRNKPEIKWDNLTRLRPLRPFTLSFPVQTGMLYADSR